MLKRDVGLAMVLVFVASLATAQPPHTHLRIVVPSGPGGAWDTTARVMLPILQSEGIAASSSVENVAGASGLIGLTRFIGAERNNSGVAMVLGAAIVMVTTVNRSALTLADVTPIARLVSEHEVLVVPSTSPFRSLSDLVRALRDRPESVSWGGGGPAGPDRMCALLLAEAAGVDPRRLTYVAFGGGGELMTAVLGGQVSVGVNVLTPVRSYIESGAVRVLAVASTERIPGVDAPTLRELGFDVDVENWRALVAPPGISASDRLHWEEAAKRLVASPQWRESLATYQWSDRFLTGQPFAQFLVREEARAREFVRKTGLNSREESPLSHLYPRAVLAALSAASLAFAVRRRRLEWPVVTRTGVGGRAVLLMSAALVAYVALLERLGFALTSAVLLWVTARAFDGAHPVRDAAWALAVSVVAYVVFANFLAVPLPQGLLAGWL